MPPETSFPWDRRDFRNTNRSNNNNSSDRFAPASFTGGGGGGSGGPQRWRDNHQPPTHPHPYQRHQNQNNNNSRWFNQNNYNNNNYYNNNSSEFRSSNSRPFPPGGHHGKQNGWHLSHPDEAGYGYVPFGSSRYGDRNYEGENPRPFPSRSNDGRYNRNVRESRGNFPHKDWKGPNGERTASPMVPGRHTPEFHNRRSVENIVQTPGNSSASKGVDVSNVIPPDPVKPSYQSAQSQSVQKEKQDSDVFTTFEPTVISVKDEKDNGVVSVDCKPLKWQRSGSISSRGSGLSPCSSSKSMAVDSVEMQPKKPTPLQSPSTDAAISVSSGGSGPLDEEGSRKKPRLGWGEGLAKYEKKVVDGPEECAVSSGLVVSVNNLETSQSHAVNLIDESPKPKGVSRLQDCVSPITPSSVACSSSPGGEKKESIKPVDNNLDVTELSCSPGVVSRSHYDGPTLTLENLDMCYIANLSTSTNEVLQSYDPNSADTGSMRSSLLNKLLVLRVDALTSIEVIETETDSLENSLKLMEAELSEEQATTSKVTSRPPPLQIVSSGDMDVERKQGEEHAVMKDDDVDSPGSATSKYVEVQISGNSDVKLLDKGEELTCDTEMSMVKGSQDLTTESNVHSDANDHFSVILASNKDCAERAMEELYKESPAKLYHFDMSTLTSVSSMVKEKFLIRKRFLLLKEKILSIKYKAFDHFWKEGRVLSVRKLLLKSHKKFDHKNNRSSNRSRINFSSGSSQMVPTDEVVNFVNDLLSTTPVKPCRTTLKMPALILDKKEMEIARFVSDNNLVVDPCSVEKERSIINPWTSEETEIFIDKLAAVGKDFKKIASFLEHKTIADCIQFYYKNHKSELFERAKKKKPDHMKQRKIQSKTYLVASGKRWNRESNAASLDILGETSVLAATANKGKEIRKKSTSKSIIGPSSSKASKEDDEYDNERVAADVLAGICGSISSEAMGSCITSSVDPGDVSHQDWRYQRIGSSMKRALTPDVTQSIDEECSDGSCGEVEHAHWTDEEKSAFIRAISLYGTDFDMISRSVETRNREQCNSYFSKVRKCLSLDMGGTDSGDINVGGSDVDDDCDVDKGSRPELENCVNLDLESVLKPNFKIPRENNGSGEKSLEDKSVSELNIEDNERDCVKSNCVEKMSSTEGRNRDLSQGQQLLSPSENLKVEKVEDASSSEASAVSCTVNELRSDSCVYHPSSVANTLTQVSESLNKVEFETHSVEKSHLVPLQENGHIGMVKSSNLFSVPIQYQSPHLDSLTASGGIYSKHSLNSDYLLSDPVDPLQILRGYPVSVQNKKPVNSDANCKMSGPLHGGIFNSGQQTNFSLQKCSSSNVTQRDYSRPVSSRSSEVPRNGDVKLFGKILTSSQPKTNCLFEQDKPSTQSLNLNFNDDLKFNFDSSRSKSEDSCFIGSQNLLVNSFGIWNGSNSQTGFSQLPDSAVLLNKYPAAFGNYPLAVSSVHSSIPSSSGGVFAIDRKQQDVLFSEMQRNMGFGMQQVGGVVGRGGLASGVSDAVTAMRMHYAQKLSLQNENICKEDLWRKNGDLGR